MCFLALCVCADVDAFKYNARGYLTALEFQLDMAIKVNVLDGKDGRRGFVGFSLLKRHGTCDPSAAKGRLSRVRWTPV